MQATISVFGLGYVGCVSAACFAEAGFKVIGVDVNRDKVEMINRLRQSPIIEPGLDQLIKQTVGEGRLSATTSCGDAVQQSDMAFICVGTPGDRHGKLQLDALARVGEEIGQALRGSERPFTVVVRSTVLPGTTEQTVREALLRGAGKAYEPWLRLAVNPEFIREGSALKDFANPPFTLVGCEDRKTVALLRRVYACIGADFIDTDIRTAETVKYACNAYHALKICFANEIGDACAAMGVDALKVMDIFCRDSKLNTSSAYLRPGFAFGGSCLPKDVKALLYASHHADVSLPLLDAILPSNQAQIQQAVDAVMASGKKRIGVFGLAFKPDTDDLRESPLVSLVESLIGKGCDVRILDQNVSIAKLTGANRNYIVEEIPHISSLMCECVGELLDHAELIVVSDASQPLEQIRADQMLLDLTRGAIASPEVIQLAV